MVKQERAQRRRLGVVDDLYAAAPAAAAALLDGDRGKCLAQRTAALRAGSDPPKNVSSTSMTPVSRSRSGRTIAVR